MLPEHRRSEIESDLFDWIDNRTKESLRRITPGKQVALSHRALAKDRLRHDLLSSHGCRLADHSILMRLELSRIAEAVQPRIPAGLSIRAFSSPRCVRRHSYRLSDCHIRRGAKSSSGRRTHALIRISASRAGPPPSRISLQTRGQRSVLLRFIVMAATRSSP